MPDWPGTPATPAPQAWPGTPATPATPNTAVTARWPGTPAAPALAGQAAPAKPPAPSSAGAATPDEDHGWWAETKRAAGGALDTIKSAGVRGDKGAIEGLLQTGKAVAAVPSLVAAPLTGAVRSFGGRAIQAGDELLRKGATKLYGEDKVPSAMTFDEAAGKAETASMALPAKGGVTAASKTGQIKELGRYLEKLFSPETVDASAKQAAAGIREISGTAARETAKTGASLSPPKAFGYEAAAKKIHELPETDRMDFIDYIQGRSTRYAGMVMKDPVLQELADKIRAAMKSREARIAALPSHHQTAFVEDYLTQMWEDPHAAQQAHAAQQSTGGGSKQGSGASFNQRTMLSYRDGVAAGLKPITTDPIEITMRYVTSMDKYLGAQELIETGKNSGMIKYVHPKVIGGTGKPNSFVEPPGWKPLDGRGAVRADGARAYAPEGYARVYNNWLGKGFTANEDVGKVYDMARRASNTITGVELALSGYHFLTVGKAALDNSLSQAIFLLRSGKPVEAIKQAAKTITAPYRYAREGKEVKDVYLGLSKGSRELQNIVEKLEKAGGRAVGKGHAPEYEFSGKGSYVTAFKRGALQGQMTADRAEAMGSPLGAAKVIFRSIGRIMDTVVAPLFEQYIPAVKNGAFRENLSNWLKANPLASEEDAMNAARQIWDDVDDRFGEMVQDNMFMRKGIKQIGMLAMRSWSWAVGQDVRMIGGAARDVARAPFKAASPRANPGPHDTRWTSKMDMAIAMPIVYGTMSMIYQKLKTGEGPQDIHDIIAPRTGGTDPATGEPERLLLPGPEKDVAGIAMHGVHELDGKVSKTVSELWHLWNNKDWRGDPVFSGAEDAPPALSQFFEYVGKNLGPISMQGLAKGKKEGSNLNRFEQMMGVRTAPKYLTDKDAYDDLMKGIERGDYRKKARHDRRERGLYEE